MGTGRSNSPSGVVVRTVLKDRLHIRLAEIRMVEDVEDFGLTYPWIVIVVTKH
jgi:hypothetical protein